MHFVIPTAAILLLLASGAPASPDGGLPPARSQGKAMVPGGCKSVGTFISSAAPVLRSAGCSGCHGGAMPAATMAFDLANLGKDDVAACAQALKKVDLANKPASVLFQATTGSLAHGGGKVPDAAGFTRAINGWIANE